LIIDPVGRGYFTFSRQEKEYNMKNNPQPSVLFVNVGWAKKYDGQHNILGNHGDIKNKGGNPAALSEGKAFLPDNESFVQCGAGIGRVKPDSSIDIVIVARNPYKHSHEIVGIYFDPVFSYGSWTNPKGTTVTWATARTRLYKELLGNLRPVIIWPPGRNMRRWACKRRNVKYSSMFDQYKSLI